jgi:acetyl esterase/lipase
MKNIKSFLTAVGFFTISMTAMAQTQTIPLWPDQAVPNFKANSIVEKTETDNNNILRISGVTIPTMTAFIAPKEIATGAAVLICPGGGYGILASGHEGNDFAKWFNERGISAFVLKYRLPNEKAMTNQHEVPLMDALQGMKLIREKATGWNIHPDKIGVMGFSAGGHLAATVSTHFNKGKNPATQVQPNFSILVYPVVSFDPSISHGGSRDNLLGAQKSEALIKYYSNELQVSKDTPPAFLIHAMDDKAVPVENSIGYYLALKKQQIPAEMHLYPEGGHGFGFRTEGKGSLANWPAALEGWLKSRQYMK